MLARFIGELINVARMCRLPLALRWYLAVLRRLPEILRSRKLYAADLLIRGPIEYRLLGRWIPYVVDSPDGNPFAFLREFAGRNVYFRGFDPTRLAFDVCVDAGANRGVVSAALSALGDHRNRVIAVEALYHDARDWPPLLARHPNIVLEPKALLDGRPESLAYLREEAGARSIEAVTMPALLAAHGIERVSFLKVDIEGGEYALMLHDNGWLAAVDNIVLEVHRALGDPAALAAALRDAGFALLGTDDFGATVAPEDADYLYASRTGALAGPGR